MTPLLAVLAVAGIFFARELYPPVELSPSELTPATPPQVYFGPLKSIAVLPFELEQAPAEQEFWSIGLSHELTRLLMQVRGLTVISSNSTLFFAGRQSADRMIAERLHVNNLLRGTLRFDSGRIQLDLRLFNVRRNADAWSRSLDLTAAQLFQSQSSLLEDVLSAVRAGGRDKSPEIEAVSTAAWISYLQGVHHRESRTFEGFRQAETAFQQALKEQPDYEMAQLALASTWLAMSGVSDPVSQRLENARAAVQKVLERDEDQPQALGLSSYISRNLDWGWAAAVESGEASVKLNPGNPELKGIASLALFSAGRFQRARTLMEEAVLQDPLNLALKLRFGLLQEFADDYDAALGSYRQLLAMKPDFPGARAFRARIKLIQDKPDSALEESEKETEPFWNRYSRILALTASDRSSEAAELLEQMKSEDGSHAAFQIAEILAYQEDLDGAFEWLDRAYRQRDGGMKELQGNFFLENLHQDPRWGALLERMAFPLDLES